MCVWNEKIASEVIPHLWWRSGALAKSTRWCFCYRWDFNPRIVQNQGHNKCQHTNKQNTFHNLSFNKLDCVVHHRTQKCMDYVDSHRTNNMEIVMFGFSGNPPSTKVRGWRGLPTHRRMTINYMLLHACAKTTFRIIYTYKADGNTNTKHKISDILRKLNGRGQFCCGGATSNMSCSRRAGPRTSPNYENPNKFGSYGLYNVSTNFIYESDAETTTDEFKHVPDPF